MPRRLLSPLLAALVLAATVAAAGEAKDTVWLPQKGERYHRKECRTLELPPTKTTRKEAEAKGYKPCKACKP